MLKKNNSVIHDSRIESLVKNTTKLDSELVLIFVKLMYVCESWSFA